MADKKKAAMFLKSASDNVERRNGSGMARMKKIMPDKESKK